MEPEPTRGDCQVVQNEAVPTEGFRWIGLRKLQWKNKTATQPWEAVERTTRKGEIDAVCIIPVARFKKGDDQLVLISQFRPPTGGYCLEFPAGLIDAGESPEMAALRELKEECGYIGTVLHVSPVAYVDPGMSMANMRYVTVAIDMEMPENRNPVTAHEASEVIEVIRVPCSGFRAALDEKYKQKWTLDARLYTYALALEQSQILKNSAAVEPKGSSATTRWLRLLAVGALAFDLGARVTKGYARPSPTTFVLGITLGVLLFY